VLGAVVDTADVDDDIAFFQCGGITGAKELRIRVFWEETEDVDC